MNYDDDWPSTTPWYEDFFFVLCAIVFIALCFVVLAVIAFAIATIILAFGYYVLGLFGVVPL